MMLSAREASAVQQVNHVLAQLPDPVQGLRVLAAAASMLGLDELAATIARTAARYRQLPKRLPQEGPMPEKNNVILDLDVEGERGKFPGHSVRIEYKGLSDAEAEALRAYGEEVAAYVRDGGSLRAIQASLLGKGMSLLAMANDIAPAKAEHRLRVKFRVQGGTRPVDASAEVGY